MSVLVCPQGHNSDDADFCSVCGSKLQSGAAAQPDSPGVCPDCAAPRDGSGGVFCEACGYNFDTGAAGNLKAAPATPAPPALPAWCAEITVDAALREEGSPAAPPDFAPRTIDLSRDSSLIGRRSDRRAIFPEVALDADDAVSHRHALLNRLPDGGLVLRDIGSSNGTRLNGTAVKPLVDMPLQDGDQITLGHWTRVVIKAH